MHVDELCTALIADRMNTLGTAGGGAQQRTREKRERGHLACTWMGFAQR